MKIAIYLGTAEYIVLGGSDCPIEKIERQWGLIVDKVIQKSYQTEYVAPGGWTVIVKPFNANNGKVYEQ